MAVSPINKPVVYKGCTIRVGQRKDKKYIFTVNKTVTLDLFGVADTLEKAFEDARGMIDKLEDDDAK